MTTLIIIYFASMFICLSSFAKRSNKIIKQALDKPENKKYTKEEIEGRTILIHLIIVSIPILNTILAFGTFIHFIRKQP